MRSLAKGMMIGGIVVSAVGMLVSQTGRHGGMTRTTRKVINRMGKIFQNIM